MACARLCQVIFHIENDDWQLIEDQVGLDVETKLATKVPRMAMIIHPMFSTAEDDAAYVANVAIDPDFDFEEECNCYYCVAEESSAPCKDCNLSLCTHCSTTPGCSCMLAEDEYVEIDSFVPDPGQSKRTTFSKAQH